MDRQAISSWRTGLDAQINGGGMFGASPRAVIIAANVGSDPFWTLAREKHVPPGYGH